MAAATLAPIAVHSSSPRASVSIAPPWSSMADGGRTRRPRDAVPGTSVRVVPARDPAAGSVVPWRRGPGHEYPARRAWGRRAAEHDHAGVRRGRVLVDPARRPGRRLGHAVAAHRSVTLRPRVRRSPNDRARSVPRRAIRAGFVRGPLRGLTPYFAKSGSDPRTEDPRKWVLARDVSRNVADRCAPEPDRSHAAAPPRVVRGANLFATPADARATPRQASARSTACRSSGV